MEGFEPPRSFERHVLSVLCLPFHHIRLKLSFIELTANSDQAGHPCHNSVQTDTADAESFIWRSVRESNSLQRIDSAPAIQRLHEPNYLRSARKLLLSRTFITFLNCPFSTTENLVVGNCVTTAFIFALSFPHQ